MKNLILVVALVLSSNVMADEMLSRWMADSDREHKAYIENLRARYSNPVAPVGGYYAPSNNPYAAAARSPRSQGYEYKSVSPRYRSYIDSQVNPVRCETTTSYSSHSPSQTYCY